MSQPELILFARQPVPGQVKTRLLPQYTPEQAAEIAAFLIRATVELAVSAWPGDVMLYVWPGTDHPLFRQLAREFHVHLAPQAEGDLGVKMLDALRQGIARQGAAAVMGCDVPHCGWDVLDQANDWLARGRNVLGPTDDGGYYFIGLQEARSELFGEMPWGSDRVLDLTLARAEKPGMEFDLLKTLRDVDTAADLWLVAQQYEPLRRFLK
ncbi:MAG: TIGR04282 family arsenosugar biosynthesis glycosyltransferase [Gammaproteobacteria bacterium]|nr:TIGR04282 family arsenosugar biosynthesis glycosyltransferase [Gammaproteobacteria bacterium]